MARQESFIKLTGKIGDVSFRKSSKGYTAQKVAKINPYVLLNSPRAQILRENKAEFAQAVEYSKILRDGLRPVTQYCKDRYHFARLNATMLRVIKQDVINKAGLRQMNETIEKELLDFDFNIKNKFDGVFFSEMEVDFDTLKNTVSLSIPSFNTSTFFKFPKEASFAKLKLFTISCNFQTRKSKLHTVCSKELLKGEKLTPRIKLKSNINATSNDVIVVLLGIEFYRNINGFIEHLFEGSMDCLKVVKVLKNGH